MDTLRLTHERLRTSLNGDQPSRERMCLAVLNLDRNYDNVHPRRPEGGPDGSRDLQCFRNSELCFGAVGFVNNVSDSPSNKSWTKKKFKADLQAALQTESKLRAFVFFTNVDLTPSEIEALSEWGKSQGVSFLDIYWRERICHVLNNTEGLAIRYQYLAIPLSEAEQASFFSRFGSEIERLVRGGFDSVERKIDNLEFALWKAGTFREINLTLTLKQFEEASHDAPEHFRVFLGLRSSRGEKRSIIIGGRDDFWESNGKYLFAVKTFFLRKYVPQVESAWIPRGGIRVGGGIIGSMSFGVKWFPKSSIFVTELENLYCDLHVTENLIERLDSFRLTVDGYCLCSLMFEPGVWGTHVSCPDWPDELTPDEMKVSWRQLQRDIFLDLQNTPPKIR